MFDMSISELLIIALFFITSINCALTYFCCTSSLKILEVDKSISKAINKLRVMDQYVLSKLNILIALVYFGLSYWFIESKMVDMTYVFFLSCLLSFPLTLITTFASRVCYCYTCNVLLETKLNEFECLVVNFKRLLVIYLPFTIISFIVPTIYLLPFDNIVNMILCCIVLLGLLVIWVVLTPKTIALSCGAKEIEKNTFLRHRLEQLMTVHKIKKYKLFYYDSSRSKESNAMVSGIRCYHLFVSSCLIEDLTLPELETVITHEIGHIKHKHLFKMMIGKLFVVMSLIVLALAPYVINVNKINFYFVATLLVVVGLLISVGVERKYESEADMYASMYNDPELFASALRKVTKYEEDEGKSKIDELFQSHPDIRERIEKVRKGEK